MSDTTKDEPFIAFPRWGLVTALRDHERHCSKCSGNLAGECDDEWYAGMLRDKIARLG